MNSMQVLESLSRVVDRLQSAIDEIEDINDNEIPKSRVQHYLFEAEMEINDIMDEFEMLSRDDGSRSGAV